MPKPPVTIAAALLLGILTGCAEPPACRIEAGAVDARVGNAACLVVDGDRLLLVRQRPSGRWGLPGGRRARGETGQCTAHRETWEETGYAVTVGPLRFRTNGTLIYQCELARGASPTLAGERPWPSRIEISEQSWVPSAELENLQWRFPDHRAAIRVLIESNELDAP